MPSVQTSVQTSPGLKPLSELQAPKTAATPLASNSKQALQQLMASVGQGNISADQLDEWKQHALQDQKLDRDEAKFLMDQMAAGRFAQDVIPAVTDLLSQGYKSHTANPIAYIGGNQLSHIHKVDKSFKLEDAKQITDENGIDEVYFRTVDDKGELGPDLYVAYGAQDANGALSLDRLKIGYVGRMDKLKIKVVHINNETNTIWEGAKAPWVSTGKTLRDAGQTGVAKGIGEVATTVTALFIGKTVIENGVKKVAETTAQTAAEKTVEAVAGEAAKQAPNLLGKAKTFGSTIGQSVKTSLRSVAVGVAVAGAIVGTVVTVGSGIGAVKSRFNHRDYATLDMITGNY
ncbi:MAG: hypothetical protein CVV27_00670 [Candidatus Melainabacteria bacterium HGW-Melainabacteria-1]|nr:MAG: hypothetical protein CVV27_00670 [Candidatus Melainabacteria bacterium HGW-Melainabacteria-1]